MDTVQRHLTRCRKCTRDTNVPFVWPWQSKRATSRVSCIHQLQSGATKKATKTGIGKEIDVFGSPIIGTSFAHGTATSACEVCGICQLKDSEPVGVVQVSQKAAVGGPRFTVTTLNRRCNLNGSDQSGPGEKQKQSTGVGVGFLIAVKDWGDNGQAKHRPLRKVGESGGGYQSLKRNLLNPRAQPVYSNEFHLTPPSESVLISVLGTTTTVKEQDKEEDGEKDKREELEEKETKSSAVPKEPVYAVVNKAGKTRNKNQSLGFSFLADTLTRKHQQRSEGVTGEEGRIILLLI